LLQEVQQRFAFHAKTLREQTYVIFALPCLDVVLQLGCHATHIGNVLLRQIARFIMCADEHFLTEKLIFQQQVRQRFLSKAGNKTSALLSLSALWFQVQESAEFQQ
jgi:hypothetical protein